MGWILKQDDDTAGRGPTSAAPPAAPGHPALAGLDAAGLEALGAAAPMRKFAGGDVLAEAGSPDDTLFLVLEGEVGLLTPQDGRLALAGTVEAGACVGNLAPMPAPTRQAAAVARGSVACMVLTRDAADGLPEGVRTALLQGVAAAASAQAETLLLGQGEMARRNLLVARQARALLEQRQALCAKSDMVRKIVASAPALPMYASRLAMLLHDAAASATDVVELAKLDPSLAGAVLKSVNSPYYNLQNKVTDLQHAVVLLGFDQVYQLAMAAGLATTMPNTSEFKELQLHANAISFIGMEVGRLAGLEKPATLATVGLLHDIGMSVVLLLKEQFPNLALFFEMLDPGKLGAMLLEKWQMPADFCQTVMYQRHPEFLPPDEIPEGCRRQVAALYLCHLCYDFLRGQREADLPVAFLPEYMKAAGVGNLSLGRFVARRLLPAVAGRSTNYPEPMRRFFSECQNRLPAGV
jgi:HD-like signal output (HDOD) protein